MIVLLIMPVNNAKIVPFIMLIKLVLQSDCGCGCYSMKVFTMQAVNTHTLRNALCPMASISSLPKHSSLGSHLY